MRELLGVMKAVYILTVVVLLHTFVKTYRTIHLKRVNLPKIKTPNFKNKGQLCDSNDMIFWKK